MIKASPPQRRRWLAAVVAGIALAGSQMYVRAQEADSQRTAERKPVQKDPFARYVLPPVDAPKAPPEMVRKTFGGKTVKVPFGTSSASTRPELAGKAIVGEGTTSGGGGWGFVSPQPIEKPFGTKGEKPEILFSAGKFVPPAGQKLQPELANLAQSRAQTSANAPVFGLIMLKGRLNEALQAKLEAAGVQIVAFYPSTSYQASIPAAKLDDVAAMPEVMWVGQPTAQQKFAPEVPDVLAKMAQNPNYKQPFYIHLFGPDPTGAARGAMGLAGAKVGVYDKDIRLVYIEADSFAFAKLPGMNSIFFIEPVFPQKPMHGQSMASINADWLWGDFDPHPTDRVKIGEMDTGVYISHTDFDLIQAGTWGFDHIAGEDWDDDGHGHGSHVAGTMLGEGRGSFRYRGVAAGAKSHGDIFNPDFTVSDVFSNAGGSVGDSVFQGLLHMAAEGAGNVAGDKRQVFNYSGGGGTALPGTDGNSIKVDDLFRKNILPCIAAGNSGPGGTTVAQPGVAKGAFTVGNIYDNDIAGSTDAIAGDSSRGPTVDSRIKPDVVAPGRWIDSVLTGTANGYTYDWNGTSMATPHVAGLAAGLIGRYGWPAWSIKAICIANALNIGLTSSQQGRGKVDALRVLGWGGGWFTWYWNNANVDGDNRYVDVTVPAGQSHLRVALVYPDAPASSGAAIALKNDLDIYVEAPGALTTDHSSWDWRSISARDNVEVININNPPGGTYRIHIHTYDHVEGGNQEWSFCAAWSDGSINPNVNFNLSTPYSVQPGENFYAIGSASAGSYVASGVYGKLELLTAGTSNVGMWYNRRSKPSSGDEWIYYPNPDPGTAGTYSAFGMNHGNIAAGKVREIWWDVEGTTEGVKQLRYSVRSANGSDGNITRNVIVDGTGPVIGAAEGRNWNAALAPDVYIPVSDPLAGIDPPTGWYRWSKDGGATWSAWVNSGTTGGYGSTGTEYIIAPDVPYGQNNANNLIQGYVVDTAGNYTYGPISVVTTPVITAISHSPATVAGGNTTTGKVTLSGPAPTFGAVVLLTNTNSKASVPASVTVPAGATTATYPVPTVGVSSVFTGTVSGKYGGVTKSTTLKVRPPAPLKVTFSPTTVTGGYQNSTGTVWLDATPIANLTVSLVSSDPAVVSVPGNVTISAGFTSAPFLGTTSVVSAQTKPTVKATASGISKTGTLTVKPVTVLSLKLTPATVAAGANSTGLVTLTFNAPAGGVTVNLSSTIPGSAAPAVPSIFIPAGTKTGSFTVNTFAAGAPYIKAEANGLFKQTKLTVTP